MVVYKETVAPRSLFVVCMSTPCAAPARYTSTGA